MYSCLRRDNLISNGDVYSGSGGGGGGGGDDKFL
jgi:hypothetical protein